jgi:hypothetical protein
MKTKYMNLAVFRYFPLHFWRLKPQKSLLILNFSLLISLFGEISPKITVSATCALNAKLCK